MSWFDDSIMIVGFMYYEENGGICIFSGVFNEPERMRKKKKLCTPRRQELSKWHGFKLYYMVNDNIIYFFKERRLKECLLYLEQKIFYSYSLLLSTAMSCDNVSHLCLYTAYEL